MYQQYQKIFIHITINRNYLRLIKYKTFVLVNLEILTYTLKLSIIL